jgi:hypothetical protein
MSDASPLTRLPAYWRNECLKFAAKFIAWLQTPAGQACLALADHGIETNQRVIAESKAAEVIFCLEHGIDPRDLKWEAEGGADHGSDILYYGKLLDVKYTLWGGEFLFWPKKKNHLLAKKRFDALALVKLDIRPDDWSGATWGWISKAEFQKTYRVAGANHALDEGTFYVHQSELHDMRNFIGRRVPMIPKTVAG